MKGIECPWCGATQEDGTKFPVLRTERLSRIIQRGRICSNCGRSFMTEERATKQTFFKKEDESNNLSESA